MTQQRVTVEDLPSLAYRGVEVVWLGPAAVGAVFMLALLATAGSVALSGDAMGAIPTAMFSVSALLYVGYFIIWVAAYLMAPVVLFLDAKKVSDADVPWDPNPWLYALTSFVGYGLVLIDYLYRRHEYVVDREDRTWWWVVAAVTLVLSVLSVVCLVVGLPLGIKPLSQAGLACFLVGLPLAAMVPIAIYKDAVHVRLHCQWHPNPALYAMVAIPFVLYPLYFPLYLGFYLFRRHRNLGLSV